MEGWPASLACAAMAAMVSQVSTKHSPLVVGFVGAAVALGWNSSKQYFFLTTSSTTKTEETSSSSPNAAEFHNDMRASQSYEVCMKFNSTEVPSFPLAAPEGNKARTATEDGREVDEDCANPVDCFSSRGSKFQGEVAIEPLANVQCPHHIVDSLPSYDTNLQGVFLEPPIVESVQPLPSESDRTEVEVARPENKMQEEDGHEDELIGFLQKSEFASPHVALTSALEAMNNVTTTVTEVLESVANPRAQTAGTTEEGIRVVLDSTSLLQPQSMAVDVGGAVEGHTSKMPCLVDKFEGFEVGCAELILETVALGMGRVKRSCEEVGNTYLIDGLVQSDGNQAESMHEVVGDGAGKDVSNFLSSDVLLPEVLTETVCENATIGDASDQQELTDSDDKIFKALTKDAVKEGVRLATEQHVARLRAYDEYLVDPKVSPHMKSQVLRAKSALQNFYDMEFQ